MGIYLGKKEASRKRFRLFAVSERKQNKIAKIYPMYIFTMNLIFFCIITLFIFLFILYFF
ncbi:hypothetical protein C5468_24715 [Photorhabdus luminescens subsp. mexicana]|uniref:Uncharacterized protein n=1 Tax=Photorhabdus luminescens subsp. mexicana TaxID=2100167 RepID=A0A4R4IPN8_PHOLU|nr:hypothetical protein C5468_24715 [Photorhabdus luminescens subsp. mexicana]